MRFRVELLLDNELIPKDKNRIIVSLFKHCFSSYSKSFYTELYEKSLNRAKSFTFSLYMGQCQFLRNEIVIPDKRMNLNFSTCDSRDGIMFYNSFLSKIGSKYPVQNNSIEISKITLIREKPIIQDEAIFKTLSPISVREHSGDNRTTWYHSLSDENGQEVFINNLRYQLENRFGKDRQLDMDELEFEILRNKEVKVKHYNIEVLGNISLLKIKAKPYLLDYIYKAGIGSQRSTGFGMIDLV